VILISKNVVKIINYFVIYKCHCWLKYKWHLIKVLWLQCCNNFHMRSAVKYKNTTAELNIFREHLWCFTSWCNLWTIKLLKVSCLWIWIFYIYIYIYIIELFEVTVFLHKVVIYWKTTIHPFLSTAIVCVCWKWWISYSDWTAIPHLLFTYYNAKICQAVRKKWQPYALMSLFDQKVIYLPVYT
jgi:hypothetical protein